MALVYWGDIDAAGDITMATITNTPGTQTREAIVALIQPVAAGIIASNPTVIAGAAAAAEDAVAAELAASNVMTADLADVATATSRDVVPIKFQDSFPRVFYPSVYPSIYPPVSWSPAVQRRADVPVVGPSGTLSPDLIPTKPLGVVPSLVVQPEGQPIALEVTADGRTVIRDAVILNADAAVKRVVIIAATGQSNNMAYAFPIVPLLDHTSGRIWQLPSWSESIIPATVPLGYVGTSPALSPSHVLARKIVAADPECTVVIVPASVNGSGLVVDSTQGNWGVGYSGSNRGLYAEAVELTERAVIEARARWELEPTVIATWLQGESDASAGTTRAAYETALDLLITDWQARFSGLFLIADIIPDYSPAGNRPAISSALRDTPRRKLNAAFVPGVENGGGSRGPADGLHYGREAVEIIGDRWFDAIPRASNNVTDSFTTPPLAVKATRWGNEVAIEWSHPYCRVTAFEVQTSPDGTTWTSATLAEPVATRTVVASAVPLKVRVRAIGTDTSNWTTPVPSN